MCNSVIRKIYRTEKPSFEVWFNGLGNLSRYVYVMELENGRKYAFIHEFVWEWSGGEMIVPLSGEASFRCRGQRIIDILDMDGVYFKMENDMVLFHDETFGSELKYASYSEYFDEKGKLL